MLQHARTVGDCINKSSSANCTCVCVGRACVCASACANLPKVIRQIYIRTIATPTNRPTDRAQHNQFQKRFARLCASSITSSSAIHCRRVCVAVAVAIVSRAFPFGVRTHAGTGLHTHTQAHTRRCVFHRRTANTTFESPNHSTHTLNTARNTRTKTTPAVPHLHIFATQNAQTDIPI